MTNQLIDKEKQDGSIQFSSLILPEKLNRFTPVKILTDFEISEIEVQYRKLPSDLKEFLKFFSGYWVSNEIKDEVYLVGNGDLITNLNHIAGGLSDYYYIEWYNPKVEKKQSLFRFAFGYGNFQFFINEIDEILIEDIKSGSEPTKIANSFNEFLSKVLPIKEFVEYYSKVFPKKTVLLDNALKNFA